MNTDCGGLTSCSLKATGCVDPYVGNAIMDPTTFALSAAQNIDLGYEEYLCIVCSNSGGGNTGMLGNMWYIR